MKKNKMAFSSNAVGKKRKHLQDYFEIGHNRIVTPNQRSLPKYKNIFNAPKREKSSKKDQLGVKRHSQGRVERPKLK